MPMHAPVAVTTGFVLVAVELDLLALAAMLFLGGLLDARRPRSRQVETWGSRSAIV